MPYTCVDYGEIMRNGASYIFWAVHQQQRNSKRAGQGDCKR